MELVCFILVVEFRFVFDFPGIIFTSDIDYKHWAVITVDYKIPKH